MNALWKRDRPERKPLYYRGMVLACLGLLVFLSVFLVEAPTFQVLERSINSVLLRGFGAGALGIAGAIMMWLGTSNGRDLHRIDSEEDFQKLLESGREAVDRLCQLGRSAWLPILLEEIFIDDGTESSASSRIVRAATIKELCWHDAVVGQCTEIWNVRLPLDSDAWNDQECCDRVELGFAAFNRLMLQIYGEADYERWRVVRCTVLGGAEVAAKSSSMEPLPRLELPEFGVFDPESREGQLTSNGSIKVRRMHSKE